VNCGGFQSRAFPWAASLRLDRNPSPRSAEMISSFTTLGNARVDVKLSSRRQ
jgi:hypothetical protein